MSRICLPSPRCFLLIWMVLACGAAGAQEARTTRWVVPAPAGGTLDVTARLIAQHMAALTGESQVVENRPGANSQIAAELVARSPADGRVLMVAGSGLAFMPAVQKMSFAPLEELVPVIQLTVERYVLVVEAGSAITTMVELAQAAARPGATLGCVSSAGPAAIACDQLKARLGPGVLPAPYPGVAPALAAVLGGHATMMFINFEAAARLVATGRLRILAQSDGPFPALRNVPLLQSAWPGFVLDSHLGVLAPAGVPAARVQELNQALNQVLADREVAAALRRDGGQEPVGGPPGLYGTALRGTARQYGELIRKLDLGPR